MTETTRRLAAVAFADVVGWSRLIEKSDEATLHAWKALRADLIEPAIRQHNGRLLEIAGDSVLVEFPSAVAAVRWALDIQRQSDEERREGESIPLRLRIGINVEDVIVDGDKLVGDGVNIASRVHQLGNAGEIIVTAAVREYVANKLPLAFTDLGVRRLKNISRPIQVYKVQESSGRAGDAVTPGPAAEVRDAVYRGSHVEQSVRAILAVEVADAEQANGTAAARWRDVVDEVENNVLPNHGGRVLKSMERGLLLGFPRVPHATKAAFDIQRRCGSASANTTAGRPLLLRMGMQIGELIAEEQEVYGGEVNLAARLTSLAGPGEIVVSAGVRDQLTPVLDADVEDLGDCYLRALTHPVRAYRVGPPGPRPIVEASGVAEDLRPTIAVIPFAARSGGPEHDVLGEILADEVISALSRTADMNVISRLSTTAFRGRDATLEEMSAHLHANYIVSGAYHVTRSRFSLVAELAEAKSRRVVWMKDLKGDIADIVGGEAEAIASLVADVSTAVTARELQKAQTQALPTLESYSLLMGAISLMHRLSRQDFERARQLLETLVERAPRRAVPQAWLAKWHVLRVWQGWSGDPAADAQLALECTKRALDSDPHCSLALVIDGMVHTNLLKQLDVAQQSYELALRANPNDSLGWLLQGTLHAFKGEGKQAITATRRALALSPLDPMRYFYDSLSATAALAARRYDQAVERALRSLRANRTHASTLRALAIAQWELGRQDDARKTVAELMKIEPTLTIRNYLERSPSSAYETGTIWSRALHGAGVPM
ncbi:MAG TPA: adenylate/guanylate cyclase domain-containing protein [Burkholderiales bacterium]|nr:adenylate/guanylate cyclase domain-containing protein [Burkholderiales bacterium]